MHLTYLIRFLCSLLLISLTPNAAHAFEVTPLLGLNYSAPTEQVSGNDLHWVGNSGMAYGLMASINLFTPLFDFESGALFLSQKSQRDNGAGLTITDNTQSIQVPLLIHYNFDRNVSIGAGAYYGFAEPSADFANSGRTSTDKGALLDLRIRFEITSLLSLILDARYQHGFTNLSNAVNDTYYTRSLQTLGGLSLDFSSVAQTTRDSRPIHANHE